MKNRPMISVIMPAYNSEKFIAESIESVRAQTYTNWELIIVDDGSIDHTENIVRIYKETDNRINYIYQENQKQGKARNTGIQNSKGELIAFLDSDDLWVPEKLEKQVSFFTNHNYDLIFSDGYLMLNDKNNILGNFNTISGFYSGTKAIKLFFKQNRIPILSVLTTRRAIEIVRGFDEHFQIQNIEDYHLWIKMLLSGFSFYGLPDNLVYYRLHNSQITISDSFSSEKVFFMFSEYLQLPKKYYRLNLIAKLNWGKNWYCNNVKDSTMGRNILGQLSSTSEFAFIGKLIEISLLIVGVKISKIMMRIIISPLVSLGLTRH